MKKNIFLLCLVLLIGCKQGGAKTNQKIDDSTGAKIADTSRLTPPDFTLYSLDSTEYTLSEQTGKVVFVNFWAPWCPPCRAEIPALIELYEKYKDKGFLILGIGMDKEKALKDYVQKNGIKHPVLIGNEEVAKNYSIRGIPTTYILDKQGKIVTQHTGFGKETAEQLESELTKLLKE
ncbi:MAG: TlpA disulfide reductase family protein [bacterium]